MHIRRSEGAFSSSNESNLQVQRNRCGKHVQSLLLSSQHDYACARCETGDDAHDDFDESQSASEGAERRGRKSTGEE